MNEMVKFGPIRLTDIAINRNRWDLWDICKAALLDGGLSLVTGKEPWYCGNVHCLQPLFYNSASSELPYKCKYCGAGINWVGIKTHIVMKCPKCTFSDEDINTNFCPKHPQEDVKLEPKEEPI